MTLLVEVLVDLALDLAIRSRRDQHGHASRFRRVDDVVGVVAFVAEEVAAVGCRLDERRRLDDVVDVSGGQMEVGRITESVHESVDLGGRASARSSNTLALGPPFPPAACWWTRTMEASMIAVSASASRASAFSTASKTPRSFQRENLECTVFHEPKRSGRSRQGTPVFAMYSTAFMNVRFGSSSGRPRRFSSCGSNTSRRDHSASVSSWRYISRGRSECRSASNFLTARKFADRP